MIPNESSLRNFFEKFWSAGDAGECIQAANDVFWLWIVITKNVFSYRVMKFMWNLRYITEMIMW